MKMKSKKCDEPAERFEAWLSGEDLKRAREAMRAAGSRRKSDFVRQRLTQAAGADQACETGKLCLSLNAAILMLHETDQPEEIASQLARIQELLRLLILARLPEHTPEGKNCDHI